MRAITGERVVLEFAQRCRDAFAGHAQLCARDALKVRGSTTEVMRRAWQQVRWQGLQVWQRVLLAGVVRMCSRVEVLVG